MVLDELDSTSRRGGKREDLDRGFDLPCDHGLRRRAYRLHLCTSSFLVPVSLSIGAHRDTLYIFICKAWPRTESLAPFLHLPQSLSVSSPVYPIYWQNRCIGLRLFLLTTGFVVVFAFVLDIFILCGTSNRVERLQQISVYLPVPLAAFC